MSNDFVKFPVILAKNTKVHYYTITMKIKQISTYFNNLKFIPRIKFFAVIKNKVIFINKNNPSKHNLYILQTNPMISPEIYQKVLIRILSTNFIMLQHSN